MTEDKTGSAEPDESSTLPDMTLREKIEGDLHTSMRDRDELTVSTLRMLLAAVQTEEVAGKTARTLADDEVLKVIAREAKKRTEAAGMYRDAGRTELATREEAERSVLETYLPAQMDDAELDMLIRAAIETTGASEVRQMGQVMKVVTPQVAGRADGKRISARVRELLG